MFEDLGLNQDTFEIFYHEDGDTSGGGNAGAVAGAVTSVAGLVGTIVQAKASKEASKGDMQQYIESSCGKQKKFFLRPKKKKEYQDCSAKVMAKVEAENKKTSAPTFNPALAKQMQQKAKQKQTNTILIVGGVLLAVGILVFLRMKKAPTPIVTA